MKKKTSFPHFEYGVRFDAENCEPVTMGEWKWETGYEPQSSQRS